MRTAEEIIDVLRESTGSSSVAELERKMGVTRGQAHMWVRRNTYSEKFLETCEKYNLSLDEVILAKKPIKTPEAVEVTVDAGNGKNEIQGSRPVPIVRAAMLTLPSITDEMIIDWVWFKNLETLDANLVALQVTAQIATVQPPLPQGSTVIINKDDKELLKGRTYVIEVSSGDIVIGKLVSKNINCDQEAFTVIDLHGDVVIHHSDKKPLGRVIFVQLPL